MAIIDIAQPGGMRWGQKVFRTPEAAALHASHFLNDRKLLQQLEQLEQGASPN